MRVFLCFWLENKISSSFLPTVSFLCVVHLFLTVHLLWRKLLQGILRFDKAFEHFIMRPMGNFLHFFVFFGDKTVFQKVYRRFIARIEI